MEQLSTLHLLLGVLATCLLTARAAMDLPKFRQMVLLYPGYYLHGGRYRDAEVIHMVGGHFTSHMHNTAPLRLSWTLNRCGGQHAIGRTRVNLSKHGNDSFAGKDGQEYIFRNTAYGPFLAARYGNPLVARLSAGANGQQSDRPIMMDFQRKQGIVRLVSYRGSHAGGHVGLWDCDHFVQSRDWTTENHIIAVEFWEAPDSYCPPTSRAPPPPPHLVKVSVSPSQLARQLQQRPVAAPRRNHRQRSSSDVTRPVTRHLRRHQGHRLGGHNNHQRSFQGFGGGRW